MTETSLKTRPSLIARLRNSEDHASWGAFFQLYRKLIYGLAIKSSLSPDEADEVVQETMATISRNLRGYEYRPRECSFKSWLFNAARWRITDQFRRRGPACVLASHQEKEAIAEEETLAGIWEMEWRESLLHAAMERVKKLATVKDLQIFDLHVAKNWPVAEVRKMLKVSAVHVYVAKHRIASLIKKEIRKLETEMDNTR